MASRALLNFSALGRSQFISRSIRYASTATAGKPDLGTLEKDNEVLVAKRRKQASLEECDQAVEGLSTPNAKARAKRLQESEMVAKSVIQRPWATPLRISSALRPEASMSTLSWGDKEKKLIHWKNECMPTLQHFWFGTKLQWATICSRLLPKLAGGKSLSTREKQQLTRTTDDILRLGPFAVFIAPFMDFLLPVISKLVPIMLPSTFQDKMIEQDRRGSSVSDDEVFGFAELAEMFNELIQNNISRPQLANMCKYMAISPFGTDTLPFMLQKRLHWIKNYDKLIQAEGAESLSEAELREDCREQGMLGLRSVEEMRQQLREWLDFSLNLLVPSSLLILSRLCFSTLPGAVHEPGRVRPLEHAEKIGNIKNPYIEVNVPPKDSVSLAEFLKHNGDKLFEVHVVRICLSDLFRSFVRQLIIGLITLERDDITYFLTLENIFIHDCGEGIYTLKIAPDGMVDPFRENYNDHIVGSAMRVVSLILTKMNTSVAWVEMDDLDSKAVKGRWWKDADDLFQHPFFLDTMQRFALISRCSAFMSCHRSNTRRTHIPLDGIDLRNAIPPLLSYSGNWVDHLPHAMTNKEKALLKLRYRNDFGECVRYIRNFSTHFNEEGFDDAAGYWFDSLVYLVHEMEMRFWICCILHETLRKANVSIWK